MKKSLLYAVAFLYLYAGIYKGSNVLRFREEMAESPLLSPVLIPLISLLLPVLELGLGLFLLFKIKLRITLWASFCLMVLFTFYMVFLYFGFEHPPCACGGILNEMDYPAHIVFNIVFSIITGFLVYLYEKNHFLDTPPVR